MLVHIDAVLRELVMQHTIEGTHVSDYTAIKLLNTHKPTDQY